MPDSVATAGIVLETSGRLVKIRIPRPADAHACSGICSGCGLRNSGKTHFMEMRLRLDGDDDIPSPGDRVRVAYRPPSLAALTAIFFLPALLGVIAGGWAGGRLGGPGAVLAAAAGMVLGFGCSAGLHAFFSGKFAAVATAVSVEKAAEPDGAGQRHGD